MNEDEEEGGELTEEEIEALSRGGGSRNSETVHNHTQHSVNCIH